MLTRPKLLQFIHKLYTKRGYAWPKGVNPEGPTIEFLCDQIDAQNKRIDYLESRLPERRH